MRNASHSDMKDKESIPAAQGGEKPDLFDKLMRLPLLRIFYPFYEKHKSILLYLFFGGVTTLVDFLTYALFAYVILRDLAYYEHPSNVIAWATAVAVAYVTNRAFVFHDRADGARGIFFEILRFTGSRVLTLLFSEAVILVFVTWLGLHDFAVKAVASVAVVILNYLLSRFLVFLKKS